MSTNLRKRSLAIGLALGLAVTGLSTVPAQADTTSALLLPNAGSTYNTIIGSPADLKGDLDPNITNLGTGSEYKDAYYVISNPSGAALDIFLSEDTASGNAERTALTFNEAGTASKVTSRLISEDGTFGDLTFENMTGVVSGTQKLAYKTSSTKVAVSAASISGVGPNTWTIARIAIDVQSTVTTTKTVSVQLLIDKDADGKYDVADFERVSTERSVTIYSPSAVSASLRTAGVRTGDEIDAFITYSGGVNPNYVVAKTGASFFKDGAVLAVSTDEADGNNVAAGIRGITDKIVSGSGNRGVIASTGEVKIPAFTEGANTANLSEGTYSSRAVYINGTTDVYIGGASPVLDLRDGTNADVDGVSASVDRSANVKIDNTAVTLRTGTTSVVVNAQAREGGGNLETSNIRVRAVVKGVNLTAGNELTVSNAAGVIDARNETITAFAFTDTKGQASFTVNSSTGAKGDDFEVTISILNSSGVFVTSAPGAIDVDFANAALTTFTASPGNFISGDTVNLSFTAKDQFGAGIDTNASGALSVYAEAVVGGIAAPATYNKTEATVEGKASFSFANFATQGSPQQLRATLRQGNTNVTNPAAVLVNVYDTYETTSITVTDSHSVELVYVDYVEGDTDTAAVSAAVKKAELDTATAVVIRGTVLDKNNAGQPGMPVTISGQGLLFKAGTVYSEDSIVANANEFGAFEVNVYAHELNTKGIPVTITADGLTASTVVKTFLPVVLSDANLSFSWSVPTGVVVNTTYAVTATLTDKWGNAIAAKDRNGSGVAGQEAVTFQGTGSVEINSSGSGVEKDLGSNGTATVFLRSIKDIAGPGAVTVTLGDDWKYARGNNTDGIAGTIGSSITTDDTATAYDETTWSSTLSADIEVVESAADLPAASTDTKVNAGSFKGYVALYAKGYEGQRMSAIVAGKWLQVDSLASNFERIVRFTGAGYDINIRIYIDGKQVGEEFNILTK